jgi:hypothetical protein
LKGSEVIGLVIMILLLLSIFSLLGYVFSASTSNDIDSFTESTTEYIVDFTISGVVGAIILLVVGFIVSILIFFGVLKRG